mmetsp:Transcript_100996/g.289878  ORF Transcript_100996/g.289878 Transcript_100996/m.289878 type:complete len:206 (-) Transcript_100996:727-1344(-)
MTPNSTMRACIMHALCSNSSKAHASSRERGNRARRCRCLDPRGNHILENSSDTTTQARRFAVIPIASKERTSVKRLCTPCALLIWSRGSAAPSSSAGFFVSASRVLLRWLRTKRPESVSTSVDQFALFCMPGSRAEQASSLSFKAQFASEMLCSARKLSHNRASCKSTCPSPSAEQVPHSVTKSATPAPRAVRAFCRSPSLWLAA